MSTSRVINIFKSANLNDRYSNLEKLKNRPLTPTNQVAEQLLPKDHILQEIIHRRDTIDLRETTEKMFENHQYYSVKEAAKQGCTLAEIRAALGSKNKIDENIVHRLIADTSIDTFDKVKTVKQTYFLEQMETYKESLLMASCLKISGNSTTEEIQTLSAQLENKVTELLIQYQKVDGKMNNPILFNVLPIGSALKLTKQFENATPPAGREADSALSLFR